MAVVGTKLTIPFTVGTGAIVGQGNSPELWALYTTDDASVSAPTWLDATAKVLAHSTARGRETELDEVDAGTATITLDNRARTFDPVINSSIRPLNRWWLREQFTGETQELFLGYAEAYKQGWPGTGVGAAECVVTCADEFKVLALANLPTTSPPRASYADVVAYDTPTGYWSMDDAVSVAMSGSPGPTLIRASNGFIGVIGAGAIVGEEPEGYISNQAGDYLRAEMQTQGDPGDVSGLTEFTLEAWLMTDNTGITRNFIIGPTANSTSTYRVYLDAGVFKFETKDNAAGVNTLQSGTIQPNVFYHVVGSIVAGTKSLYVNGGLSASVGGFPGFATPLDAGAFLQVGDSGGLTSDHLSVDNMAFYRYGLSAATVANHYTAGTARGFVRGDLAGARINRVLDTASSHAPRTIGAGTASQFMTGSYMVGQPPLDELRKARQAENVDAILFVSRSGAIVFLDAAHRSSSPYNTVQATFDDDGTDLPYADATVDFSDAFLTNEWNVTRTNGLVQTASDATSRGRYFKRSQSLTDIPVTNDTITATMAAALLAKYKDPFTRVTSITLTTDVADVAEAAFRRDLGDRIRVFRTPPGGGARIDQTLFIQKIQIDHQNDARPWVIRWAVSPL